MNRIFSQLSVAVALTMINATSVLTAEPTPINVLLITGGCCHDYEYPTKSMQKALEDRKYLDNVIGTLAVSGKAHDCQYLYAYAERHGTSDIVKQLATAVQDLNLPP